MTTTETQAEIGRTIHRLYEMSAEAELLFEMTGGEVTAESEKLQSWLDEDADGCLLALVQFQRELSGRMQAMKAELTRLQGAMERTESKADWTKRQIVFVLSQLGVKSREVGTFSLSILPPKASVEIDENHPPDLDMLELEDPSLVRRKEPELAPDKKAILAALESGRTVPGFYRKLGAEGLKVR